MIFLRVLPKIFLWPHYSGARGPGSLNRLNPSFLYATDPVVVCGYFNVHADKSDDPHTVLLAQLLQSFDAFNTSLSRLTSPDTRSTLSLP